MYSNSTSEDRHNITFTNCPRNLIHAHVFSLPRFVNGQPGEKLPSGLVHGDALGFLLDGLYHYNGTSDSPISLEELELFAPRSNTGGGDSPGAATDGGRPDGAHGVNGYEKGQDGGGATKENDEGKAAEGGSGDIEQEPESGVGEGEDDGE